MSNPLDWISDSLSIRSSAGLVRELKTRESPPVAGLIQIDGQQYVNFSSNDYLGIAADQRLIDSVQRFSKQLGWGSGASALVTGHGVLHRRLETELAKFKQSESSLLFPTGYAANMGVITSLVGKGDIVLSDSLNHASIIDGCRLSGATVIVYPHNDHPFLRAQLANIAGNGRRLIVTDGLFSMDGDFAPLVELKEIADEFHSMLMIDEAHATGIFGHNGRGACEQLGIEHNSLIRVGTLSKAFGSMGGFVTGSNELIKWIYNSARSYIFSTAQPEAISAASLAALDIIRTEPNRREHVRKMASQLRARLTGMGIDIAESASQIIPIIVGSSENAVAISERLRQQGLLVPAIRPPSVPDGHARLRISLSYSHQPDHMDKLCDELKREIDFCSKSKKKCHQAITR